MRSRRTLGVLLITFGTALGCGFGGDTRPPIELCAEGQSTADWFAATFPNGDPAALGAWVNDTVGLPRHVYVCPKAGERFEARLTWVSENFLTGALDMPNREDGERYGPSPLSNPSLDMLRIEYPLRDEPGRRVELDIAYDPL